MKSHLMLKSTFTKEGNKSARQTVVHGSDRSAPMSTIKTGSLINDPSRLPPCPEFTLWSRTLKLFINVTQIATSFPDLRTLKKAEIVFILACKVIAVYNRHLRSSMEMSIF